MGQKTKKKAAKPRAKPAPRPMGDRGQGRKAFDPTPDQQRLVEAASGMGLRHTMICQLVIDPKSGQPIDPKTLRKHFPQQLQPGKAKTHFNVGKSLYDQAVGIPKMEVQKVNGKDVLVQTGWITPPNVTAGIWFSKAQMKWREGVSVEITDLEAIVSGLGGNLAALRAARAAVPAEED